MSSINLFPCILSNALLISRRSIYTASSGVDNALPVISVVTNICSVIDLFLRCVAWDMAITKSNLKLIFLIIQTANIFLETVKRIIGQSFDVGLLHFPGFCSVLKISCLISFGCFPVAAIILYLSAIFYTQLLVSIELGLPFY